VREELEFGQPSVSQLVSPERERLELAVELGFALPEKAEQQPAAVQVVEPEAARLPVEACSQPPEASASSP
jgi:hypothetical protein